MASFFFSKSTTGLNEWWRYLLTIALVATGMFGFGGVPFFIALRMKDISVQDIERLSPSELNGLFTNNEMLTYNLFSFVVGFVMLLIAFRMIHHKRGITFFTSREKFDLKRFFTGFGLWGVFLVATFIVGYIKYPEILKWNYDPQQFFMLLLICLFLVPIQTGFEELLCRGYLLQLTGRATSRGLIVVLINGIVFGGLHAFNPEVQELGWFAMTYFILSGCFAALLTVMDDGIELSWGFHTVNNLMGLLIVSSEWQSLRTDSLFIDISEPSVGAELVITLVVGYPLMILMLSKIYRWNNWKLRLLGKS